MDQSYFACTLYIFSIQKTAKVAEGFFWGGGGGATPCRVPCATENADGYYIYILSYYKLTGFLYLSFLIIFMEADDTGHGKQ